MNEIGLFQVQATVQKVTTMTRWIRIIFDTQENLNTEQKAKLFDWHDKLGHLTFSVRELEPDDILDLPKIAPSVGRKSPSQRLRAVLYRKWERDHPDQEIDSESHYIASMEKIINMIKETL